MKEIIFATGNKAKIAQFRFLVYYLHLDLEIIAGREAYGDKVKYEEIGETVGVVAKNGALDIAKAINMPVVTEDTDFRVYALNGEPGIRSGEYLVKHGRKEILQRLEKEVDRKAEINSALAYAEPNGFVKVFENTIYGSIAEQESYGDYPEWIAPNNENPFGGGYNAIFIPDGWNMTLAEISPEESTPWSYREKNFIDFAEYLLEKTK